MLRLKQAQRQNSCPDHKMSSLGQNCILLYSKRATGCRVFSDLESLFSNMSELCVLITIFIYHFPFFLHVIYTKFSLFLYCISNNTDLYSNVIKLYILYCNVKKGRHRLCLRNIFHFVAKSESKCLKSSLFLVHFTFK